MALITSYTLILCPSAVHAVSESDFIRSTDIGIDGHVKEMFMNNDIIIAVTSSGIFYVKDGTIMASYRPIQAGTGSGYTGYSGGQTSIIHISAVKAEDIDGDGYPEIAVASSANQFPNVVLLDGRDAEVLWEYRNEEEVRDYSGSGKQITRSWDITPIQDSDADGLKDFVVSSGYRIIRLDSNGHLVSSKNPDERFMNENDIWKLFPLSRDSVLVGDQDGNVFMYDLDEEDIEWKKRISEEYTSSDYESASRIAGMSYYREQKLYASVWDIEESGGSYYASLEDGKLVVFDERGNVGNRIELIDKNNDFFSDYDFQTTQFYNHVLKESGNGVISSAFDGINYTLSRIEGGGLEWSESVESSNIALSEGGDAVVFRNNTIQYLDMKTGVVQKEIKCDATPPVTLMEIDEGIMVGTNRLKLIDDEGEILWEMAGAPGQEAEVMFFDITGDGIEEIIFAQDESNYYQYNYDDYHEGNGGVFVVDGSDMSKSYTSPLSILSLEKGIIASDRMSIIALDEGEEEDMIAILGANVKPARTFRVSNQIFYGIYDELLKNTSKLYEYGNFSQHELDLYKSRLVEKQGDLAELEAGDITPEIQEEINLLHSEINQLNVDISILEYRKVVVDDIILNNESYRMQKKIIDAASVPDQNSDGVRDLAVLIYHDTFFILDSRDGDVIDYMTTCHYCAMEPFTNTLSSHYLSNFGIDEMHGMEDGLILKGSGGLMMLGSDMNQLWNFTQSINDVHVVGDMTGDGEKDVYIKTWYYDDEKKRSFYDYLVLNGATGEVFIEQKGNAEFLGTEDFNGDGREELIVKVSEEKEVVEMGSTRTETLKAGDMNIVSENGYIHTWAVLDGVSGKNPGIAVSENNKITIYDVGNKQKKETISVDSSYVSGDIVGFSGNLAFQTGNSVEIIDGDGRKIGGFSGGEYGQKKVFSHGGELYILSGSTLNRITIGDTEFIMSPNDGSTFDSGFEISLEDTGGIYEVMIMSPDSTPQGYASTGGYMGSRPMGGMDPIAYIQTLDTSIPLNFKGGEYDITVNAVFKSGLVISDSVSVNVRGDPVSMSYIVFAAFVAIAAAFFVLGRFVHVYY